MTPFERIMGGLWLATRNNGASIPIVIVLLPVVLAGLLLWYVVSGLVQGIVWAARRAT